MPKQATSLSAVQPKLPNPNSFNHLPLSGKHFCVYVKAKIMFA